MISSVYLDYNSTTPMDPRVADAMFEAYRAGYCNPASQHQAGQKARRALEAARRQLLSLLGAKASGMDADDLVFTSGGTESNHLALTGALPAAARQQRPAIAVCAIEHPSVWETIQTLKHQHRPVVVIPVDEAGRCRLDHLETRLAVGDIGLVTLMLANNETGVIQPVAEVSRLARQWGVLIHCDAVQAVGKIPVSFTDLGVDLLSFTAHKFYGPRGIGGLIVKHRVPLEPTLHGGFQQKGLRPGTEDVALVRGCLQALSLAVAEMDVQQNRLSQLSRRFLELLQQHVVGPWQQLGVAAERLPHTLSLAFPGVDRQALLLALDLAGIYCSTGSACASGSSDPSPVLLAMGVPESVWQSALRFSLGWPTTVAEIEWAVPRIARIVNDLRK